MIAVTSLYQVRKTNASTPPPSSGDSHTAILVQPSVLSASLCCPDTSHPQLLGVTVNRWPAPRKEVAAARAEVPVYPWLFTACSGPPELSAMATRVMSDSPSPWKPAMVWYLGQQDKPSQT